MPGDEAMKTLDPVCVLLELSQAEEFTPMAFIKKKEVEEPISSRRARGNSKWKGPEAEV